MPNSFLKCSIASFLLFAFTSSSAQNLKLWYNKPATVWTEALPIGNGRIGAMVHGGVNSDHISNLMKKPSGPATPAITTAQVPINT